MKNEDFGQYRLQYRASAIMEKRLTSNVSIEMDLKNRVSTRIAGISVGVLIFILILGIVTLGLSMKRDISWFYKRHFGPFEKSRWREYETHSTKTNLNIDRYLSIHGVLRLSIQ